MTKREAPAASSSSVAATPEAIVITRTFDAPRELVYQAWVRPEIRKQWYGPRGLTTTVFTIDPRPGGMYHYCMRAPDGREYWMKGVFREVVPPERLTYVEFISDAQGNQLEPADLGMAGHPRETLVEVTFAEDGGRTTVTLRHELPAGVPGRDHAAEGWRQTLERLAELLAESAGTERA